MDDPDYSTERLENLDVRELGTIDLVEMTKFLSTLDIWFDASDFGDHAAEVNIETLYYCIDECTERLRWLEVNGVPTKPTGKEVGL